MARSKIEWLAREGTIPESWNPISGCDPDDGCQSEACIHCYARRMSKRLAGRAGYPEDEPFRVTWHPDKLGDPLRWAKPRTVFVCSMGDLWHRDVACEWIEAVLETASAADRAHTFLFLTKRPKRMRETMLGWAEAQGHLPGNWWLGVTAENQKRAEERVPILLQCPAKVHFVSCEPLLGDLNLTPWLPQVCPVHNEIHRGGRNCLVPREERSSCLDWVIAGGESGARARPTRLEWARSLRDQCQAADIPFFWKQWGEYAPVWNSKVTPSGYTMMRVGRREAGRLLDKQEHNAWPET